MQSDIQRQRGVERVGLDRTGVVEIALTNREQGIDAAGLGAPLTHFQGGPASLERRAPAPNVIQHERQRAAGAV